MGFISALKTIGKDIASGVDDIALGARRLKDASWKALGVYDRNLEGKTLMRFGNEAEARWVTPFRPTSRKVYAGINYESKEKLNNAVTNIIEDEATAFDTSILAKRSSTQAARNFERSAEEQVSKIRNAASEDYSSLLGDAGEITAASTGTVNAKEISEAAMRDTGYGLSAEDMVLKRNRPNYVNELQEQGARERAAAKTTLGSDATVNATGTTQPDIVTSANNNMGSAAQVASEVNRTANVATQQGIQAAPSSTAGQVEAAAQTQKALETTENIPVANTAGSKDIGTAVKYLGANTAVIAGINATHGSQSNAVLYGQQALGI